MIHTAVAVAVGLLIITGTIADLVAWIFGIAALGFLATSFVSFYPLYLPFEISTVPKEVRK